jgi:hypothetical protein
MEAYPVEVAAEPVEVPAPDVQRRVSEPSTTVESHPVDAHMEPVAPSAPDVQRRTVDRAASLSHVRDPRVLARRPSQVMPPARPSLPLSERHAPAVLPQTQPPVQETPAATIQRALDVVAAEEVRSPAAALAAADVIQRTAESRSRPVQPPRRAVREKKQRAALPLAKLRSGQTTVQRTPEEEERRETFIGASEGSGPQSISGPDQARRSASSRTGDVSGTQASVIGVAPVAPQEETEATEQPDLDLLARAILPLVKRMIALERERRPVW